MARSNKKKQALDDSVSSDAASTSNSSVSTDASTFVKGSEAAKEKMAKMRAMRVKGKKAKNIQEMSGLQLPVHKMKRTMRQMNANNKGYQS
ncbi:Oidioi.mRNA.OKI2018_I69.XSR.g14854.t1.cds [Oikopleura dioica]|uniref:Oidioi.mRNA.OKI2018_I69.XSR.g14854.t1.cds n=1 Tax=Oikopleura dioica TaxID=34765 RepID=A0ABN7SG72_OIKDI|nr:Oidioi.mRNA.OKI2018_I69.XSR.g14854.t1.cds [Oikopleura dioica]